MQSLSPGSLLQGGKYKIEQFLGQGGCGITYSAVQVVLNRRVAIKEFFMKDFCEQDSQNTVLQSYPLIYEGFEVVHKKNISNMKHYLLLIMMALLPAILMAQKHGGEIKRPRPKVQEQTVTSSNVQVDNAKNLEYNIISSTEVEVKLKNYNIRGAVTVPSTVKLNGTTYVVTKVASLGFYYCKLSSITLPGTIKTIDVKAFENCEYIEHFIIPKSVESIGWQCFSGCRKLKAISIPASVKEIATDCFYSGLQKITVAPDNAYYCSEDGVLYNKDKTLLHTYPGSKQGATFTIPSTVNTIARRAFSWNWKNLKTIVIPNSVKSIEEFAFAQSGINSIDIPSSVQSIGENLFWRCSDLISVTVPEHLLEQLREDTDGFRFCENLKTLNIRKNDGTLKTMAITDL